MKSVLLFIVLLCSFNVPVFAGETELKAKQGDAEAQYNYAFMLILGQDGVERNPAAGMSYLKSAAKQGYLFAQIAVAFRLSQGLDGISPDPIGASEYLFLAADRDPDKAKEAESVYIIDALRDYALSLRYEEGAFSPAPGFVNARLAFRLAAERGDIESLYEYALMELNGIEGPKDVFDAASNMRRAASASPPARYQYGLMLYRGVGVPVDLMLAKYYFTLASNDGIREAKEMLFEERLKDIDISSIHKIYKGIPADD